MSRLEAALRRARTGVVDPQAPQDEAEDAEAVVPADWALMPAAEPVETPWSDAEPTPAPSAPVEPPRVERRRTPRAVTADEADGPRFREFSSKHAD